MPDFVPLSAVTVRPLEPYLEWARSTGDGVPVDPEDWTRDPNVYLLPKAESLDELMEHIGRVFIDIWVAELELWDEDESRWPEELRLEDFLEWFALVGHTGVITLLEVEELP